VTEGEGNISVVGDATGLNLSKTVRSNGSILDEDVLSVSNVVGELRGAKTSKQE
jgi:hypothetical protein